MPRLPAIRSLADDIRRRRRGRSTIGESASFLVQQRPALQQFGNLWDLVEASDPELAIVGTTPTQSDEARALIHHLSAIRGPIVEELWAREIFVDYSVVDELLFHAAKSRTVTDPIVGVLELIRDARATRPGFVVFPVHSLGVLGAGLLIPAGRQQMRFISPENGYALSPQTNSMQRTIEFLDQARDAFGIAKDLPTDLIEHWRLSRPTAWLERNPLLVVRTTALAGSYYGNERPVMTRIQATTALLTMLSALQPSADDRTGTLFSTRMVNNFQTLDIHHYLALFDGPYRKRYLDGQCIPIHASRSAVSELSDLEIDIDPRHWRLNPSTGRRVHAAVEDLYGRYLRYEFRNTKPDAVSRTVKKLFESMAYFRRSYQRSATGWIAKVSLATAFEMLLTDSYGAVGATLTRRTGLLLRGVPGTRAMQAAVRNLYDSRSAMVHRGSDDALHDIDQARRAYVLCLVELVERLPQLTSSAAEPIRALTADQVVTATQGRR